MPSIHQRPDPDIARDAAVAIKDFLPTYHEQIKVVVKDGWITFEGEVEWQFQRQAPETAIRALQGIKGVTNLIKIKPRVTSEPPIHQFDALLGRLRLMSSWAAARLRSALVVLGIVLGLVPSPAPDRLRSAFLVVESESPVSLFPVSEDTIFQWSYSSTAFSGVKILSMKLFHVSQSL
jgi:hypothetical protein